MSSKTRAPTKNEEATLALVPKLRFPEFRGAKGWDEKTLGDEGEILSALTGKAGADFDVGEARFVTYMNVFSNTFVDPKALRFVDVKEGEYQNAVLSGDVFFTIEPVLNFVFLDFLSGGVELFVETNHKLTHRLFPVVNRHCPAFRDIA